MLLIRPCAFSGENEEVLIAESIFLCDNIVIKHKRGNFFYLADSTYSYYLKIKIVRWQTNL